MVSHQTCSEGATLHEGNCYLADSQERSFSDVRTSNSLMQCHIQAATFCASKGAALPSLNTDAAATFLTTFATGSGIWLADKSAYYPQQYQTGEIE